MRYLRTIGAVMFLLSFVTVTAHAGATKDDAVKLVQATVAYYKANGLEKTLDEIPNPKGPFNQGELYVWAYDLNITMLAHPNTSLVGQNMLDVADPTGKKYRREIAANAARDGKGWTEYKYQNPKTKEVENKITYYEKVDDLIICCGIYQK